MKKKILISFGTRPEAIKLAKLINQLKKINKLFTLGFFGLTYKPDSNDIRESPSFKIVKHFSKNKKLKVIVYEPNLNKNEFKSLKINTFNIADTIRMSNLSIILVNHQKFKKNKFRNLFKNSLIDISGLLQT